MIRASIIGLYLIAVPATAEGANGGSTLVVDASEVTIVDGDTVRVDGERIRISNIDTPEARGSRCALELTKAIRAKGRLTSLLRGTVRIDRNGEDRFGRTLARLSVGGRDVGEVLIAEGHAIAWEDAGSRDNRARHWCGTSRRWRE